MFARAVTGSNFEYTNRNTLPILRTATLIDSITASLKTGILFRFGESMQEQTAMIANKCTTAAAHSLREIR
jgi:hypothetical protein